MPDLSLVSRLCDLSVTQGPGPLHEIPWPERIAPDVLCFSPELLSLAGTEAYEQLDEAARQKLGFYEAVNFFSLNINGERPLVEGIARRLYKDAALLDCAPYLHCFLDEENKHMQYFGTFCLKYANKVYPDKKLAFPREFEDGEEDFLFFLKVMIFEEIADAYNQRMARDGRLAHVVREINRLHHVDESRHLVFGRALVSEIFERHRTSWSAGLLDRLPEYIESYLRATWKEYFNPEAYRDAGLAEGYRLAREAFEGSAARGRRQELSSRCVAFLLKAGILQREPAL